MTLPLENSLLKVYNLAGGQHLLQIIYVGYISNDFEGIASELEAVTAILQCQWLKHSSSTPSKHTQEKHVLTKGHGKGPTAWKKYASI